MKCHTCIVCVVSMVVLVGAAASAQTNSIPPEIAELIDSVESPPATLIKAVDALGGVDAAEQKFREAMIVLEAFVAPEPEQTARHEAELRWALDTIRHYIETGEERSPLSGENETGDTAAPPAHATEAIGTSEVRRASNPSGTPAQGDTRDSGKHLAAPVQANGEAGPEGAAIITSDALSISERLQDLSVELGCLAVELEGCTTGK